ncbi:hypothetical protein VKT23_006394 [Stygiomarasmius scandens]|uniref:BTB domain-containing protein n=1 Tax=Marasmiellus scandens TaxID=2682957 RepID=A0ABR1JMN0_9AGAR
MSYSPLSESPISVTLPEIVPYEQVSPTLATRASSSVPSWRTLSPAPTWETSSPTLTPKLLLKFKTITSTTFSQESGGDIVFRSSDNVLFYVHQKYLEAHAEGFPLAEHIAPTRTVEHVPLAEESSVLELLFQFVYPRMPPDLESVEFPALMSLAEAAEKYFVHHARKFCLMRIRAFIPEFPLEIIAFAADHSHDQLLYQVAPRLVFKPLSEMAYILPSSLYVPWSMYHDQCTQKLWKQAIDKFQQPSALSCTMGHSSHTNYWRGRAQEWKVKISNDVSVLSDLDEFFNRIDPMYKSSCCREFTDWQTQLKNDFTTEMKDLEYFRRLHRTKMSGRAFKAPWGVSPK